MQIKLGFNQKFYGIVYAQRDRNSACKIAGKGEETAKIDIPLKGCGTQQVGFPRLISNFLNIIFLSKTREFSRTTLWSGSTPAWRLKETK